MTPQYTIRLSRDQINADRDAYDVTDTGDIRRTLTPTVPDNSAAILVAVESYPDHSQYAGGDMGMYLRRYLADAWRRTEMEDPNLSALTRAYAERALLIDMARDYYQHEPCGLADTLRAAYVNGTRDVRTEEELTINTDPGSDSTYDPDTVPF